MLKTETLHFVTFVQFLENKFSIRDFLMRLSRDCLRICTFKNECYTPCIDLLSTFEFILCNINSIGICYSKDKVTDMEQIESRKIQTHVIPKSVVVFPVVDQ